MSRALFWFKNDLRLDDNPGLARAAQHDEMLGVYCVDARFDAASAFGPPRVGAHRKLFLSQALDDLRDRMAARGGRLIIRAGEPQDVLPALVAKLSIDVIVTRHEIAPEEQAQIAGLHRALDSVCRFDVVEGGMLYRSAQLPFPLADLPGVFTRFRKAVETGLEVDPPRDAPERLPGFSESVDCGHAVIASWSADRSAGTCPYTGGETAGRARVAHYLWESQALSHYKQTRNQMLGLDFSSKLSPWLAAGCLSARRVAAEVARFEAEIVANTSTYWLLFELRWREFYHWTLAASGAALFQREGILGRDDRPRARNADVLDAWQRGRTGMPFVDANMRELAATGYMSNRGRQNVASFLARDLAQDWRCGAAWFEGLLVDYDAASNWGNWATVAGVGTDKRDAGFNVLAQALRYDPRAEYVTHWLPELGQLAPRLRHVPFLADDEEMRGIDYPRLRHWPESWTDYLPDGVSSTRTRGTSANG